MGNPLLASASKVLKGEVSGKKQVHEGKGHGAPGGATLYRRQSDSTAQGAQSFIKFLAEHFSGCLGV